MIMKTDKKAFIMLIFTCISLAVSAESTIQSKLSKGPIQDYIEVKIDSLLQNTPGKVPEFFENYDIRNISDQIFYHTRMGTYFLTEGKEELANNHFNKGMIMAASFHELRAYYNEIAQLAYILNLGETYDKSIKLYNRAIRYYRHINDSVALAMTLSSKSSALIYLGKEQTAMSELLEAYDILKGTNEHLNCGVVCDNIATIYENIGKDSIAVIYLEKAIDSYKHLPDSNYLAFAYGNLAISLKNIGKRKEALNYYKAAGRIADKTQNINLLASNKLNIGNLYDDLGNYELAMEYYLKSLNISEQHDIKYGIYLNKINIGTLYNEKGNYSRAIELLNDALKLEKTYRYGEAEAIYENLYEIYKGMGNASKALAYLELFSQTRDSTINVQKHSEIMELQTKYETKQKEARILQLEKRQKQDMLTRTYIVGWGAIIFISLIFFVVWLNQKRKISRQKTIIAEKKLNNVKLEMEHKNKELASYGIYISQIKEFSKRLTAKINEIKKRSKKTDHNKLDEMLDIIENYSHQTKSWEEYDKQFRELNIDFIHRLAKKHPELSSTEIRICSFLCINMTTKDIANITSRSQRTIENFRYRIRNKMKLDRKISLTSYIQSI